MLFRNYLKLLRAFSCRCLPFRTPSYRVCKQECKQQARDYPLNIPMCKIFVQTDESEKIMMEMLFCKFNIDTASVETIFSDGSMLSIYSPAVDDELELTIAQQTDLDWLMYNEPKEYMQLILSGEIMDYLKYSPMHGLED